MKSYYVCVSTDQGWEPVKEFRLNGRFPYCDPNEKLSFEEADKRLRELERDRPDRKFTVIETGLYKSLNS